jgi:hypothetical protein
MDGTAASTESGRIPIRAERHIKAAAAYIAAGSGSYSDTAITGSLVIADAAWHLFMAPRGAIDAISRRRKKINTGQRRQAVNRFVNRYCCVGRALACDELFHARRRSFNEHKVGHDLSAGPVRVAVSRTNEIVQQQCTSISFFIATA